MQLVPGAVIKSTYRLERPLAAGGMGALWVASHVTLGSRVAVKFMDVADADPVARARFQREAQSLAAIHNPHVVGVHDYGTEGDTPFIVMDLLEGEDLGTRLKRVGRLSLPDASRLLTQIGRGLRAAHAAGIVHRDLKPANVFLALAEGEETVKILDFGPAKNAAAGAVGEGTKTGDLVGSPHYMSPEQIRSPTSIDPRSDLWSLAVILFRVLSGELPFKGKQVGPVLAQILTENLPRVTEVAPDLPPALDAFFARGLARDPALRFQSAQEMAHDLARITVQAGYTEPPPQWADPSSSGPSYSSGVTSISTSLPGGAWGAAPAAPASVSHPSPSHPSMSQASTSAGNPATSHPGYPAPQASGSGQHAQPPAAAASGSGQQAPAPVPPGSLSGQLTLALVSPESFPGQPVPPLASAGAPAPAKPTARPLWALGVAVVAVVLTGGVLVATLRSEPDAAKRAASGMTGATVAAPPTAAVVPPPISPTSADLPATPPSAEPPPPAPSAASSTADATATAATPTAPHVRGALTHPQPSAAPADHAEPRKKRPNWGF